MTDREKKLIRYWFTVGYKRGLYDSYNECSKLVKLNEDFLKSLDYHKRIPELVEKECNQVLSWID